MWGLPIQSHLKLSTNKKRQNKAKCLTWNSRLKLVKKTSMPKALSKVLGISSATFQVVLDLFKALNLFKTPSNTIRYNCQKICSWSRRLKIILEIRKNPTFLPWSTSLLFTGFLDFTNHRKKINREVVFSCTPFPQHSSI